ncbi:MAG TPA: FAD-dependent oxidoreductase [Phycisphaerales bacterium]|nr:FAD-dependent oxidoreductase [Phycisphaerales bacterium]
MSSEKSVGKHHEPARDLPVAAEVDVLVVGAGPAGVGAALAAVREGARTLLVEKGASLGGTWTLAFQTHATCFHDRKGRLIVGGISLEILQRLHAMGAAEDPVGKSRNNPRSWHAAFDSDMMRCLLDDMMEEAGVQVLLHAFCADAIREDQTVGGIVVETKSGRLALRAKVTVDCTGDGDVVCFSGADFEKGRPKDGKCQPGTTTFLMSGVNREAAEKWWRDHQDLHVQLQDQARKEGRLSVPHNLWIGTPAVPENVTYHNVTRVHLDSTDAWSLSRAEALGRRQVREVVEFYRKHVPGFEQATLLAIAPQLGLRESRRVVGLHRLTAEDVLEGRKFEDAVARHNYYIDVHAATMTEDDRSGTDLVVAPGEYYEIPYRCLVPVRVDQLLVAGRCISASREALGSARTTVCCCELGQAAGVAAAWAAGRNCLVRDVNGRELSKKVLSDFPV